MTLLQGESTVRNEAGLIRILGYSFILIVLTVQAYTQKHSGLESTGICALFIYVVSTFFVYYKMEGDIKTKVHMFCLCIDSFICGLFLAFTNDSELIMFMLLIVQTFVFVASGGLTCWAVFMVTSLLSNLIINELSLITPLSDVSIASEIIGGFYTMLFTLVVSLQRRDRTRKLIGTRIEQIATIKKLKNKSDILSNYLSPQIVEMHEKKGSLQTTLRRKTLTICFIDLVGFSTLTEESEPEVIAKVLKDFFSRMSKIAINNEGTIDKFIGDGMMVFFGDPISSGITGDAARAIKMSMEMQKSMKSFNKKWESVLDRSIQIRIGINTGICNVGNIGSNTRLDYTAIGKAVNIASRIEGIAEAGGVCVGNDTYKLTKRNYSYSDLGDKQLKGMQKMERIYKLNIEDGKLFYEAVQVNGAVVEISAGSKKELNRLKAIIKNDGK